MKRLIIASVLLLVGAGCAKADIASFEECAASGNPVMESSPRQCRAGGTTFVETLPSDVLDDGTFTLKKGETKTSGSGLAITLAAIEDSRCPKDVQCIWAGEFAALLSMRLLAREAQPVEVRLGQTTRPSAEALGYAFTLTAIDEGAVMIDIDKL